MKSNDKNENHNKHGVLLYFNKLNNNSNTDKEIGEKRKKNLRKNKNRKKDEGKNIIKAMKKLNM